MKKKIIFLFFIVLISIIIFIQITYKLSNSGNNIIKSDNNNILNIRSYEAIMEVEVYSNKNTNKYVIKQQYLEPNLIKQEVVEPENIRGLITIFDGTNLTIENNLLGVKALYENYKYVQGNSLSLNSFIEDYLEDRNPEINETDEETIIKVKVLNSQNKYEMYKKLYIDKDTRLPTKMEILDINQNITVYILYREIKINQLNKEDIIVK
ncbi:MAG: hypothetical protein HFJ54_07530 [Clostridia bacterium]|nr:hypothetical protein [Clostridia bacterium]